MNWKISRIFIFNDEFFVLSREFFTALLVCLVIDFVMNRCKTDTNPDKRNSCKKRVLRNFDDLWDLWPWRLESIESPFWPLKWIVKVHLWYFCDFSVLKPDTDQFKIHIWAHMFIYLRLETNWRSLGGRELETPEWLIPLRKIREINQSREKPNHEKYFIFIRLYKCKSSYPRAFRPPHPGFRRSADPWNRHQPDI